MLHVVLTSISFRLMSLRLRYFLVMFIDYIWFFKEMAFIILKIEVLLFFFKFARLFFLLANDTNSQFLQIFSLYF